MPSLFLYLPLHVSRRYFLLLGSSDCNRCVAVSSAVSDWRHESPNLLATYLSGSQMASFTYPSEMVCEEPPPEFRDEEQVLCMRGRLSSVPRNKPMPMVRRLTCEGEGERGSEWERFVEVITIAVQGRRLMRNGRLWKRGMRRERGGVGDCGLAKSFWRNLVCSHLIVVVIAVVVIIPYKKGILTMCLCL